MTPFMDEHSEMPVFHVTRQNDDARICAYAEHRTTRGAILSLFLAFEYIHTAQIMYAHSTITKNDLQGHYALLHSNCKNPVRMTR